MSKNLILVTSISESKIVLTIIIIFNQKPKKITFSTPSLLVCFFFLIPLSSVWHRPYTGLLGGRLVVLDLWETFSAPPSACPKRHTPPPPPSPPPPRAAPSPPRLPSSQPRPFRCSRTLSVFQCHRLGRSLPPKHTPTPWLKWNPRNTMGGDLMRFRFHRLPFLLALLPSFFSVCLSLGI